ncbi:unnamed protein product [Ectocarpus sp. CCAP 1310/34]|nr:unnamed protein product [Ectocarpus sp. CCAP 1310/34]
MLTRLMLLLAFLHTASSWSATATAATTVAFSSPPRMLLYFSTLTSSRRHGGQKHQIDPDNSSSSSRQPWTPMRPLTRGRATFASRAGERSSATRMSSAPSGEGRREGNRVVGSIARGGDVVAFVAAACSAFPSCSSAAAAAAAAIVGEAGGSEMGARVDPAATASFAAVVVAFAFLQSRIRTAVRARTARRNYEVLFKGMKAKQLAGQADEKEVKLVEERMSQLLQEEQEARKVDIFGIPFNLVIPDGGAGGEPGTAAREAQQGRSSGRGELGDGGRAAGEGGQQQQQLGIRETMKAKAESDLRGRKAREEEMSTGATLKVAALWLVLISQLWLLVVLWNDPMGPASSTFLQD